jgi:hypothetical protein
MRWVQADIAMPIRCSMSEQEGFAPALRGTQLVSSYILIVTS